VSPDHIFKDSQLLTIPDDEQQCGNSDDKGRKLFPPISRHVNGLNEDLGIGSNHRRNFRGTGGGGAFRSNVFST
jgi:hypothetical protein